mmetsp:Transcript_4953/g.8824  ORF Transcript_4953/g.8824 Transcript_4953/m.8824 type:complete len:220 (+) Transcript_4953:78-737(+)|eukprot:CAMPEP_0197662536 /NCGR_PEP_ID=MMETSP1338-20131121/53835_1 /TAXON_ID=43686 ORGANISM="Pelagodinium beii, Strain RCC1491" /NCGR_SAMPLE_ID=MMETSP1338 /ASSEMBLY_ACC=CAM_ASM_000754 /LENGTH=219 /DNA_ID=CAMNT_0043240431 /DNA_START=78 /DNA_END=737 /DNA_ORIENTATION=+
MALRIIFLAASATLSWASFGLDEALSITSSYKSLTDAKQAAVQKHKPGIVLVLEPWCPMCRGLVKSINENPSFQSLLSTVEVSAIDGDASHDLQFDGEAEGYVPRVYFVSPEGKLQDIRNSEKWRRFYGDSTVLEQHARKMLLDMGIKADAPLVRKEIVPKKDNDGAQEHFSPCSKPVEEEKPEKGIVQVIEENMAAVFKHGVSISSDASLIEETPSSE